MLKKGHAALYRGRSIITDRTAIANKPDTVMIDRQDRRRMFINVAVIHDEIQEYLDLVVVDVWDVASATFVSIIIKSNSLLAGRRFPLRGWMVGLIQEVVHLAGTLSTRVFSLETTSLTSSLDPVSHVTLLATRI